MDEAPQTFHWEECAEALLPLLREGEFRLDDRRIAFESSSLRVVPPLVLPIPDDCTTLVDFVADVPVELGRQLVLLMQAGAVSIGLFEDGQAVSSKSFKKYVVRGKGKAQPTHLDSKGKSRYGSRLRLQNAKKLLEETNEVVADWIEEFGPLDQVFYNAPVRLWASLFQAKPEPPFEREAAIRIPRDLPVPTTTELMLCYKSLCYGRIEELEA